MDFEDILKKENITFEDLREFQRIYDERFVDAKFTGFDMIRHTTFHLSKLLGKLSNYCEKMEHKKDCSALIEQMKKEVSPDLKVYGFWIDKLFGVEEPVENYFARVIDNMERVYPNKISVEEIEHYKGLLNKRLNKNQNKKLSKKLSKKIKKLRKVTFFSFV